MIVNLCGAGSSGSTFLARMLDRHPQIACGGELYLFNKSLLYRDFPRFRRLAPLIRRLGLSGNPHNPDRTLFHDLSGYGLDPDQVWAWVAASSDIADLAGRFADQVKTLTGKPLWVEKTPSNSRTLGAFLAAFPQGRAIHLVRDPRDQALSAMRRGRDLAAAAGLWLSAVGAIWPLRGDPRLLEVRYEDLVLDFDAELGRVCAFLGVGFNPAWFADDTHASAALGKGRGHASWRADPGAGPSAVSVGGWRGAGVDLAPLLAARLAPGYAALLGAPPLAVHEVMAAYGYDCAPGEVGVNAGRPAEGSPPAGPRAWALALLDGAGAVPRVLV